MPAKQPCSGPATTERCPTRALVNKGEAYCVACRRERDKRRGSRQERGYGRAHELRRAAELPDAYGQPCIYCGNRMWPHENLVLDHTEDRTGYRGIVHADYRDCPAGGNAAEGASRGNRDRRIPPGG